MEECSPLSLKMKNIRCVSMLLALSNVGLGLIGMFLMLSVSPSCPHFNYAFGLVSVIACIRIGCMAAVAKAQHSTAISIVGHSMEGGAAAITSDSRLERQRRYRRWLWWTRFGIIVNAMQFLMALYIMLIIVKDFYRQGTDSTVCFLGHELKDIEWKKIIMLSFLVLMWLVAIIQCFTGTDVLRWRSFYETHDTAWRAHYREVFDHGIREALYCLGRVKYLSVLEEDEVYSVARLLGDLVAYRATGTGHLELLAGLALLQKLKQSPKSCDDFIEAPDTLLEEATVLHQFAEAAYTGPLLDFGRNPVLFLFLWLYRQGVLNPWACKRRPILDGDNWWRGHAAAFLKYVNLPPESLRHGRVCQKNRGVAYFIVVLHAVQTVVIAIRGTETPEDLITDGLCRECNLSENDLDGLINFSHLHPNNRETIISSYPRFGHSGIVESARELYMQIDCLPREVSTSERTGLLSSLVSPGCECEGYKVRIVGHSLGGAVGTLLGLRLKGRYPNLHVYAYGPLPCVDFATAEACSDFVTSIVYNDEFSSRLSVNSVLRLFAAAIKVLSDDSSANSAVISKLARKILSLRKHKGTGENCPSPSPTIEANPDLLDGCRPHQRQHMKHVTQVQPFPCSHAVSFVGNSVSHLTLASKSSQPEHIKSPKYIERSPLDVRDSNFVNDSVYNCNIIELPNDEVLSDYKADEVNDNFSPTCLLGVQAPLVGDSSQLAEAIGELKEVFLAGLVIHIVLQRTNISPIWKFFVVNEKKGSYKAYVAKRGDFKDIILSPYMFLDHLPWRCLRAMRSVLETQKTKLLSETFNGEGMV